MEFVLYLGRQSSYTVTNPKLSKIYRFDKGVPVPVANESDKTILLLHTESSGCGTCGNKANSRPIMSDVAYCTYQRLDLIQFRKSWSEKYKISG